MAVSVQAQRLVREFLLVWHPDRRSLVSRDVAVDAIIAQQFEWIARDLTEINAIFRRR